MKPRSDYVRTITTNTRFWLRRRQRLVTSYEMLAMQGIPIQISARRYGGIEFSERERIAIAGNAYNGFSFCVQLASQTLCLGKF